MYSIEAVENNFPVIQVSAIISDYMEGETHEEY
jgi:hypothetical protein